MDRVKKVKMNAYDIQGTAATARSMYDQVTSSISTACRGGVRWAEN